MYVHVLSFLFLCIVVCILQFSFTLFFLSDIYAADQTEISPSEVNKVQDKS